MSFLRGLRALVLGETWTVPIGVTAALLLTAACAELAGGAGRDAAGFVLLAAVLGVLGVAVRP